MENFMHQPPTWTDESQSSLAQWDSVERSIREFLNFGDDWDGMGAEAPKEELLLTVSELIATCIHRGIDAPDTVVPVSHGGFLFEWHNPGMYVEAEVIEAGTAEFMIQEDNKEDDFYKLQFSVTQLYEPVESSSFIAAPSVGEWTDVSSAST